MSSKKKSIAIFDISSGSVGGTIVSYPSDKKIAPEIIFSVRNEMSSGERMQFSQFLEEILKLLNKTALEISSHGEVVIDDIYCFFTSPWATLHKNEIESESRENFVITEKVIEKLLEKDGNTNTNQDPQFFEHSDMITVERNITGVELNGYRAEKYLNQKAKNIKIYTLDLLMSKNIKSVFEKTIEDVFLRTPNIKSSMLILNIATELLHTEINDAVIIDIGNEMTEIGIADEDKISRLASFPYGENNFKRAIAAGLNIDTGEARSLYKMYFNDSLENGVASKIVNMINQERKNFLHELLKNLDSLSKTQLIPNTIFISSNNEIQSWISGGIMEIDLSNIVSGRKKVKIITLDNTQVQRYIEFRDKERIDSAMGLQVISMIGQV